MIISHSHRFIYLAPTKTASSSVFSVLQEHFGAEEMFKRHSCFVPKEYQSYFTFVTVRNPFTRFLSAWAFWGQGKSIQEWSQSIPSYYKSICHHLFGMQKEGCVPVRLDSILHVETLYQDLNNLPFITGYLKIPRYNTCQEEYPALSPEVADFIRQEYRDDFKFFGYDPEIVPRKEANEQKLNLYL